MMLELAWQQEHVAWVATYKYGLIAPYNLGIMASNSSLLPSHSLLVSPLRKGVSLRGCTMLCWCAMMRVVYTCDQGP